MKATLLAPFATLALIAAPVLAAPATTGSAAAKAMPASSTAAKPMSKAHAKHRMTKKTTTVTKTN
jgi:hypothetical protein